MRSRWLRLTFPVLLLLVSGVTALRNGVNEFAQAATLGQRFATASELAHGLASWVVLAAIAAGSASAVPLAIVWAVLITITAATAAVAWGGAGLGAGAAAAVIMAALSGLAVWLIRKAGPGNTAPQTKPQMPKGGES